MIGYGRTEVQAAMVRVGQGWSRIRYDQGGSETQYYNIILLHVCIYIYNIGVGINIYIIICTQHTHTHIYMFIMYGVEWDLRGG